MQTQIANRRITAKRASRVCNSTRRSATVDAQLRTHHTTKRLPWRTELLSLSSSSVQSSSSCLDKMRALAVVAQRVAHALCCIADCAVCGAVWYLQRAITINIKAPCATNKSSHTRKNTSRIQADLQKLEENRLLLVPLRVPVSQHAKQLDCCCCSSVRAHSPQPEQGKRGDFIAPSTCISVWPFFRLTWLYAVNLFRSSSLIRSLPHAVRYRAVLDLVALLSCIIARSLRRASVGRSVGSHSRSPADINAFLTEYTSLNNTARRLCALKG